MSWLFGRRRRRAAVAKHVEYYNEGLRLMRNGDPPDEWFGMRLVRENLVALVRLGCDEFGEPASKEHLVGVLWAHGLREAAGELGRS